MRYSILSAACAAALGLTALTPSDAKAQIVVYPQVSGSPYVYYGTYWHPGYGYNYRWVSPYGSTWSYGWANPFNYGTYRYSWYNPYPYSGGFYARPWFGVGRWGFGRWWW